ncbi:hypothetical protein KGM_212668A, partial [Danaus plexippus plexippus]
MSIINQLFATGIQKVLYFTIIGVEKDKTVKLTVFY